MGQFSSFSIGAKANTKLPEGLKLETTPIPLMQSGFNLLVTIAPPSLARKSSPEAEEKSITVMAHFDTGASKTNIDHQIAKLLGLSAVGIAHQHTAGGLIETSEYAVDLSFPSASLKPFHNLRVSSCKLPFKVDDAGKMELSKNNFGVLIGRDIMSKWNIVWNGPTSTVFVSD